MPVSVDVSLVLVSNFMRQTVLIIAIIDTSQVNSEIISVFDDRKMNSSSCYCSFPVRNVPLVCGISSHTEAFSNSICIIRTFSRILVSTHS